MKKFVAVCFAMTTLGLNTFGETNAVPATASSLTKAEPQGQKVVIKPKTASSPGNSVYHSSEVPPAQIAAFHRIDKQNLLTPPNKNRDFGAMMEAMFHPGNDVGGPTCIRGAIITVFPPAH